MERWEWKNDNNGNKADGRYYGVMCTVYDVVMSLFWAVIICGLISLLWSCKGSERIVEVEKEVVKIQKDTVRTWQLDSVYVRDSSWMRIVNDTVYMYKDRWREKLVVKKDTVVRERMDTVRQVKVDRVVEQKKGMVRWWWVMVGWFLGMIIGLVLIYKIKIK